MTRQIHTTSVAHIATILPAVIVSMILPSLRRMSESEVLRFIAWLEGRGK